MRLLVRDLIDNNTFFGVAIYNKKFYGWSLETRVLNMPEKKIAH